MVKLEKDLPNTPVACPNAGSMPERPAEMLAPKTEGVKSESMTSQTLHLPSGTSFQSYRHMMNHTGPFCVPGVPAPFLHDVTGPWSSMAVNGIQMAQHATGTQQHGALTWQVHHNPQIPAVVSPAGCAGDQTCSQLPNPTSGAPPGATTPPSTHSSKKPFQTDLEKRALRLMKNREAARQCRRKKKEYVRCLENRVATLEDANKALMDELSAFRDAHNAK